MLAGTAIGAIGMAPWQGNLNALVAECSEHTFLQYGKRIDGTMYSCTSMGLKIGSGLGTAIVGWLLNFGGFNGQLKVQSQSCINMLHFMYLWLPMIINILVALLLTQLNVEKANDRLLCDKNQFLHTLIRELLCLCEKLLHRHTAVRSTQGRDNTIGTPFVTAFGNL